MTKQKVNLYRILTRFSPAVRAALKAVRFTNPSLGGNVCGTGYCPLGMALVLSGYRDPDGYDDLFRMPNENGIAQIMVELGLAPEAERYTVKKEAEDFVKNYSDSNNNWKRAL